MTTPTNRPLRNYPVAEPDGGNDPRFSFGLLVDLAVRLEAAGYPPITSGADLTRLSLAVFRFCYATEER
ncbi:hypothetical protein LN042_23770 [Kitasatospora sp. RB6PN24]|uniref:hypothetical protein n=1 Tax=Kitasatospora humi TaxID=2893891 RepID=UPI001E531A75|nr:hypothetical protein [Kitasatospora humi]MCC9310049.1 hypothetical protein [Kitasatospora humi]